MSWERKLSRTGYREVFELVTDVVKEVSDDKTKTMRETSNEGYKSVSHLNEKF